MIERKWLTEQMIELLAQPNFLAATIILELGEKGGELFVNGENAGFQDNLEDASVSFEDFMAMIGVMQQAKLVILFSSEEGVMLSLTEAGQEVYRRFQEAIEQNSTSA